MQENPVEFLGAATWSGAAAIGQLEQELEAAGFRRTTEIARVSAIDLVGQAWHHPKRPLVATVYESGTHGCWSEVYAHDRTAACWVATSSAASIEWAREGRKEIRQLPGAAAGELVAALDAMTKGRILEPADATMLVIHLHSRLTEHWRYVYERSPGELQQESDDRCARVRAWVAGFVRFFRPLGFLTAAGELDDDRLAGIIVAYDERAIDLFPGLAGVCDDFDDIEDFFTMEQVERMPGGDQEMDVRLLAVLDPERVRWPAREEVYEIEWDEAAASRRIDAEGLVAVEYRATGEPDRDDPFACRYTILVPPGARDALARKRGWSHA